jgi:predicted membrane protein
MMMVVIMIIVIMLIAMVLVVVISNNLIFETLNLHYQEIIILIFKYVHYKKISRLQQDIPLQLFWNVSRIYSGTFTLTEYCLKKFPWDIYRPTI